MTPGTGLRAPMGTASFCDQGHMTIFESHIQY